VPRISGSSTVEGLLVDWSIDQPVDLPGLPVALLSKEQAAAELQRQQRRKRWMPPTRRRWSCGWPS
jgi:hypothetical protein